MVKHARARRATVRIAATDDTVSIEVSDDGRGFDPAAVGPDHFGLRSMRGRVATSEAGWRSRARPAAVPPYASRFRPSDDGAGLILDAAADAGPPPARQRHNGYRDRPHPHLR